MPKHQPFSATDAQRAAGAIDMTRPVPQHPTARWAVAIVAAVALAAILFIAFLMAGGGATGGGY